MQCCIGPIKMEIGRFKAGPFHSERRLSQNSLVLYILVHFYCILGKNLCEILIRTSASCLFQMGELSSSKLASQPCSDSGNLASDADKISKSPDLKHACVESSCKMQTSHFNIWCVFFSCRASGHSHSRVHQRSQRLSWYQYSRRRWQPSGWHTNLYRHDESCGRGCSDPETEGTRAVSLFGNLK